MVWVEFFKVYDSFNKMKSPILYGKAIKEGDLIVKPLAEEVTEEIPEAVKKLKQNEEVINLFPYIKDVDVSKLVHIAENNIYGFMIRDNIKN